MNSIEQIYDSFCYNQALEQNLPPLDYRWCKSKSECIDVSEICNEDSRDNSETCDSLSHTNDSNSPPTINCGDSSCVFEGQCCHKNYRANQIMCGDNSSMCTSKNMNICPVNLSNKSNIIFLITSVIFGFIFIFMIIHLFR